MSAGIVKEVLKIEEEADRLVAGAEAEAKRVLAGCAGEVASLREKAAAETEAAVAKLSADLDASWTQQEKAMKNSAAAERNRVQETGAGRLSSAAEWIVRKVMESR